MARVGATSLLVDRSGPVLFKIEAFHRTSRGILSRQRPVFPCGAAALDGRGRSEGAKLLVPTADRIAELWRVGFDDDAVEAGGAGDGGFGE